MRSRDANHTSLFRFCTIIILLYSSALFADEYLISYRDTIVNSQLYNQQFYLSKSMQKCQGIIQPSIIIQNPKNLTLQKLLISQETKFYHYTQQIGLKVQDNLEQKNKKFQTKTSIIFTTKCFKVDVNENFVKIAYIKKENN